MSSNLYESTSIRAMCQEVQKWDSQVAAGTERERRRRKIDIEIRAVVALPERLNTENCVDLIFCSHRIIPLVTFDCWANYLFVFDIASFQLSASIVSEESARRWLEYHDGGINLITDEIVRLLAFLRDAHLAVPPVCVSLGRALAATIIGNLIGTTYSWQSAAVVGQLWDRFNGLFPDCGGLFLFIACMLEDCSTAARYSKRGMFQAKSDQEEQYFSNSLLRLSLVKLLSTLLSFPSAREGPEVVQCVAQMENIIWEPHYKARDAALVAHVIDVLAHSPRWPAIVTGSVRVLEKLSSRADESPCSISAIERDKLKERWVEGHHGVGNIPLWFPTVVHHLLVLMNSVVSVSPVLVCNVLCQLVSIVPTELVSVFSDFVAQSRQLPAAIIRCDPSGRTFSELVGICARGAVGVGVSAGGTINAEALGVLFAELCLQLKGGLRAFDMTAVRSNLDTIQRCAVQSLFAGSHLVVLFRVHVRHLLCEFLAQIPFMNSTEGTFCYLRELLDQTKELLIIVKSRCQDHGTLIDDELGFLRQETALVATAMWRAIKPCDTTNPSLLSSVTDLVSFI
jgi:hypothetical protein